MKFSKSRFIFLFVLAASVFVTSSLFALDTTKIAKVYNGKFASGSADFEGALTVAGYKVQYFSRVNDLEQLAKSTELVVFPGTDDNAGSLDEFISEFSPLSIESLRTFVRNGGKFLGVCGGAYIISKDYHTEFDSGLGLSLVDVTSEGYLSEEGATILDVTWKGKVRTIYYQLGPKFIPLRSSNLRQTATYADGAIAACMISEGRGIYYLVGPHPEVLAKNLDKGDVKDGTLNKLTDTSDLLSDIFRDLATKK
jgi:glutamine amidotransferase-like uncharacterized protein